MFFRVSHPCYMCDSRHSSKFCLERHIRRMHCFEDLLRCQSCGHHSNLRSGNDILKHGRCHYGAEHNYDCCVCGRPIETQDRLDNHLCHHMHPKGSIGGLNMQADHCALLQAEPGLLYHCEIEGCGQSFVTNQEVERHVCGTYDCELCCAVYNEQEKLEKHITVCHNASDKALLEALPIKKNTFAARAQLMQRKVKRGLSSKAVGRKVFVSKLKTKKTFRPVLQPATMNKQGPPITTARISQRNCENSAKSNEQNTIIHYAEKTITCKYCTKGFSTHFSHKMHMRRVHNITLIEPPNNVVTESESGSSDEEHDEDVPTIIIEEHVYDEPAHGGGLTGGEEEDDDIDGSANRLSCMDCGQTFDTVAGLTEHSVIHVCILERGGGGWWLLYIHFNNGTISLCVTKFISETKYYFLNSSLMCFLLYHRL